MNLQSTAIRILKYLLPCLIILGFSMISEASGAYRVLQLNSYHPEFPTAGLVHDGAMSVFAPVGVEMDVEYLDTKRHPDEQITELAAKNLAYKLQRRPAYAAVLTSDDNALHFALRYRDTLFKGLPIVFCGVNDVDFALSMNGDPGVTGVIEAVSLKPTIDLIFTLSPSVKRIIAIADATSSGRGDLRSFLQLKGEYPPGTLDAMDLARLSWNELEEQLKHLQQDTALLLLSAYGDVRGVRYDFATGMKKIVSASPVPVYHLWRHGIGGGLMGGIVVSHYHQARAAALMVLDILHNGKSPGSIPVTDKSPNVCMFDASLMARWHLDASRLPSGAELVNPVPHSFTRILSDSRVVYLAMAAILAALAGVLVLLRRIKRMQRMDVQNRLDAACRGMQDSREYLKSIMDSLPEALVLLDCDGRIVDWNRNAEQWATIPGKLGTGKDFFTIFSSLPLAPSRIDLVLARREAVHIPNSPVMLGGLAVYADILVCPVRSSEGDRVLVRCADISGQVRIIQYLMGTEWLFSLGGTITELTKSINSPLSAILLAVQNINRRLGDRLPENEETARLCGTSMGAITAYCDRRDIVGMLAGIREASEIMVKQSAELSVFVNEERNEHSSVNLFELVRKAAGLAATETRLGVAGKEHGMRFVFSEAGSPDVLFARDELELALLCFFRWHGRVCADVWQSGEIELAVTASVSRSELEVSVCNPAMEYNEQLRMLPDAFAQRQMRLVPYMGAELTLVYLLFILRHNGTLAVHEHPDGGVVTSFRLPTGN
jgi:PAS domain-containing protein/ABC-type uncharacterized transport system substrate-binding protein